MSANLLNTCLLLTVFSLCLSSCNTQQDQAYSGLTHCVFLDLTEDVSPEDLRRITDTLSSLANIEEVRTISVVERTDVGDARALVYDLMLIATFDDKAALSRYDKNPNHQLVRGFLKPFLASAPATFDFEE